MKNANVTISRRQYMNGDKIDFYYVAMWRYKKMTYKNSKELLGNLVEAVHERSQELRDKVEAQNKRNEEQLKFYKQWCLRFANHLEHINSVLDNKEIQYLLEDFEHERKIENDT